MLCAGSPQAQPFLGLCDWEACISLIFSNKTSSGSSGRPAAEDVHLRDASSLILKPVSGSVAHYLLNREDQREGWKRLGWLPGQCARAYFIIPAHEVMNPSSFLL